MSRLGKRRSSNEEEEGGQAGPHLLPASLSALMRQATSVCRSGELATSLETTGVTERASKQVLSEQVRQSPVALRYDADDAAEFPASFKRRLTA